MRRTLLFSLIAFVYILISVYLFRLHQLNSQVECARKFYGKYVEDFLERISVGYFQWTTMYECVTNRREDEIQKWLDHLRKDFPQVESVELVQFSNGGFEFFKISSFDTKLRALFKVYNDDLSEFVPNEGFSLVVDAQKLLEETNVDFLKLAEDGEDFAFGLKYKRTEPVMNGVSIAVVVTGTVLVCLFVGFAEKQKKLIIDLRRETKLSKVLSAILEILEQYLKGTKVEDLYQLALEKAIETIPGAQAGSVVVKKGDSYVFTAVVGYDDEKLLKLTLSPDNVTRWAKEKGIVKRKEDVLSFQRDEETLRVLKEAGRLEEIRCNFSFAVEVDKEIAVLFNLDNFEEEDAFDEEAIETAKIFASYLGVLFSKAKLEEELNYLSSHDPLTGLSNRRMLEEYGEKLLSIAEREGKNVAVMFIDLGGFKKVNDLYGHHFGDEVLKLVAVRLKETVRHGDLVARFGGDEFVVVAYDCSRDNAEKLAWRIVKTLNEKMHVKDVTVKISAHIGVAVFPSDGTELGHLIRLADMAMYRAKSEDRGMLFYSAQS